MVFYESNPILETLKYIFFLKSIYLVQGLDALLIV